MIGKGTLVIRDGTVSAVGAGIAVPADARVWDLSGMTIYPGFIDAYSDIGVPKKPQPGTGQEQQPLQGRSRGHLLPILLPGRLVFSPNRSMPGTTTGSAPSRWIP